MKPSWGGNHIGRRCLNFRVLWPEKLFASNCHMITVLRYSLMQLNVLDIRKYSAAVIHCMPVCPKSP